MTELEMTNYSVVNEVTVTQTEADELSQLISLRDRVMHNQNGRLMNTVHT